MSEPATKLNDNPVTTLSDTDCIVCCDSTGSLKSITKANLINTLNTDDEMLLRQVAWGVPLKQTQSSTAWGVVGNEGLRSQYESQIGRYLVTADGLAGKLSPTDSSVFADGTALDETKGNVMVIAPRLYYKVTQDAASGVDYLWMSQLPIGGHYIGNCNNDQHICLGAYMGSVVGSTLVSRSGLVPTGSKTISSFWDAAQGNGKHWGIEDYDHVRFLEMLALGHYGDTNVQAKLGYGVGGSASVDVFSAAAKLTTGATSSLGDALAKIDIDSVVNPSDSTKYTTNSSRVSVFGVEDPYNWFWQMIQGVFCGSSANSSQTGREVFIYEGNRIPSTAELSSHPAGAYRQTTRREAPSDTSGFVKTMILGEYFDLWATEVGGGSTSYWADYEYINNTGQLVLWGGYADHGSLAGLAFAYSRHAFSFAYSTFGARLAYYGPLTFVPGKQLIASVA